MPYDHPSRAIDARQRVQVERDALEAQRMPRIRIAFKRESRYTIPADPEGCWDQRMICGSNRGFPP